MAGLPATLWSPRQQEIARTSDPFALRDCNLYLIIGRDPWAGVAGRFPGLIVIYVGETWRTPAQRLGEHLRDQWFAKDIVSIVALPVPARNKAEAWEIERRLVALLEPPYNREYNGSNQWLIKEGRAVHRDDLPPQPSWWPYGDVTSGDSGSGVPSWLKLWWLRRRWWVIGSVAVWLALFVGACWLAAKLWDGSVVPKVGAVAASIPLAGLRLELWRRRLRSWRRGKLPKRRRRRR
jgi:hypothetical protein